MSEVAKNSNSTQIQTCTVKSGTYIIIGDVRGYISGAPIYYRNKAICLKQNGWQVTVFSATNGKEYVSGLHDFTKAPFPFLHEFPAQFSSHQRLKLVKRLEAAIDFGDPGGKIIIETGTDWTAYWGELLAEQLHGRHVVLFLDENNRRVSPYLDFFDFKHRRNEFACITPQTTKNFFKGYKRVKDREAYSVTACCSNSIQNVSNGFSDSVVLSDFNIGSIGRLDKVFVPQIVDAVIAFAGDHRNLAITVVFFGGSNGGEEEAIRTSFASVGNVRLYISGYMWPLPKQTLEAMDVCVSAAGSCTVSAMLGIPTIMMDVLGNGAIGFRKDKNELYLESSLLHPALEDLLDNVLKGEIQKTKSDYDEDEVWESFCRILLSQVDKDCSNRAPLEYYDIGSLPLVTRKQRIKSLVCRMAGYKRMFILQTILRFFKTK